MSTTTKSNSEITEKAKDALKEAKERLNEDPSSWSTEYNKNGTIIRKIAVGDSPWYLWSIETTFEHSTEVMFEIIHNTEDRTKWDDVVTLFKVVRTVDSNIDVVHSQTCSMFGGMIGARDFVDIRIWEQGEKVSYSAAVSHAIEEVPDCKGYIRGYNYLIGYKIEKTGENSCYMKYMMRSDVKGQMPAWLVNKGMNGAMDKVYANIKKYLAKK